MWAVFFCRKKVGDPFRNQFPSTMLSSWPCICLQLSVAPRPGFMHCPCDPRSKPQYLNHYVKVTEVAFLYSLMDGRTGIAHVATGQVSQKS